MCSKSTVFCQQLRGDMSGYCLTTIAISRTNRNDFHLQMKQKSYLNRLREHRLKVTPRRRAVINLFLQERRYFSPFEVWNSLKAEFSRIGLPTIYRILEELRNIGILTKIERESNRQLCYFLCPVPSTIHHHHFVCRKCKRVEPVEFCDFSGTARFIEEKLNGKVEKHFVQIEGVCSQCKEND